ncbi:MAG TPA: LCP family protein [Cellulomonas sp.]|uniref:LCP family protein n=1 Tax=Cellulomonas sp. TaxID=40001 RepID=UPI002E35BF50|nr:LCP family protein [Cellulomonas sp.]HEX5332350.1 LCP family protein [Cellulomonas sp.]
MPDLARSRPSRTPRHSRARRDRAAPGRRVALVVVAVLAFGGSATAVAVSRLRGNVGTVGSLDGLIAAPTGSPTDLPAADLSAGRAVTFVVIGSDTRSGGNAAIGGEVDGMRADTTIVVHLAADRSRVDAVSIPRDSEANIPACHLDRDPAGRMSRPRTDKFNAAFSIGGSAGDVGLAAACTMSTIAAMTGLAVTEFALVDFAGFQGMVEAIGGIRVCVPTALKDYKDNTELDLAAGWHDLDGPQALDYVRARYVTGSDGSDVQRIARQQDFIAAVVRKALSADVLTSPVSLAHFLDAGTRSLTMSDGLAAGLPGMAWGLRGIDPSTVTFVTVPWGPGTKGRIVWTDDATTLWERIAADVPITGVVDATVGGPVVEPTAGLPAAPGPGPAPTPAPPPRTGVDPDEALCGPFSS